MDSSVFRLLDMARRLTAGLPGKKRIENLADLQRALDVSSQRMTNWKKRGISKEGALDAEERLGVSATFVLTGHASQAEIVSAAINAHPPFAGEPQPNTYTLQLLEPDDVPHKKWEDLMNLEELPEQFRVSLNDSSLAPELLPGDEITFERSLHPEPGDIALLQDHRQQYLVRTLRAGLPGQWLACGIGSAFEPLEVKPGLLQIVAIASSYTRRRRRSAM